MCFPNRLSSKEIYNFLTLKKKNKLHQDCIIKICSAIAILTENIYLLVRIVTKDSKLRAFQIKLLNHVLYLNKMLFKFGKSGSPLCSFCNLKNETPYHLL